jgi:Lon protease-like protein
MIRRRSFHPAPADLPKEIPIFPLGGGLLLPGGRLPLNIFEPRYLAMVEDALAAKGRLIGMIQPRPQTPVNGGDDGDESGDDDDDDKNLYPVGCAGRIVSFAEIDDGRYGITLLGVCRFALSAEVGGRRGYRRAQADWSGYLADLAVDGGGGAMNDNEKVDRKALIKNLRAYLERRGLSADWDAVGKVDDAELITSLAMLCPFSDDEKQALLEAEDRRRRADMLMALLQMGQHGDFDEDRAGADRAAAH